jgi:small-conductance mechanosensitive channel
VSGIAVALAVQNILDDLLAALAIVFDKPFDVGDRSSIRSRSSGGHRLKTTHSSSTATVIVGNGDC